MNEQNLAFLSKHTDILSFRDLSENTIKTYSSYLSQFINWTESCLDGKPLPDVTWEEIRSYILFLKKDRSPRLNPRTINVHISQLRDFCQYVLHRDWNRYEIPFLHYDEKLPKVPSKEEVTSVIDSLENLKHKSEIALLYATGIRVSELCRLHCGDIHRKERYIYISRSKNRSDRRAVWSDHAYEILRAYMYYDRDYNSITTDSWLFPGQKAGSHISEQAVYLTFKKQLSLLSMSDQEYNLHSLRHAFGLHLYEAGTDLMTIKEAMGHKSLSSTQIYLTLGIGHGRSVKSPYDS